MSDEPDWMRWVRQEAQREAEQRAIVDYWRCAIGMSRTTANILLERGLFTVDQARELGAKELDARLGLARKTREELFTYLGFEVQRPKDWVTYLKYVPTEALNAEINRRGNSDDR